MRESRYFDYPVTENRTISFSFLTQVFNGKCYTAIVLEIYIYIYVYIYIYMYIYIAAYIYTNIGAYLLDETFRRITIICAASLRQTQWICNRLTRVFIISSRANVVRVRYSPNIIHIKFCPTDTSMVLTMLPVIEKYFPPLTSRAIKSAKRISNAVQPI